MINQGRWAEADYSSYTQGENIFGLVFLLKGQKSGLSLKEIQEQIRQIAAREGPQEEALEELIEKAPGLSYKIREAFERNRRTQAEDQREEQEGRVSENQTLEESGYPRTHRLFASFAQNVKSPTQQLRHHLMTSRRDLSGYVSSVQPLTIFLARSWADDTEAALLNIVSGNLNDDGTIGRFLGRLNTWPHEYVHTEEFLEGGGRSSHWTHQREGVLENSFPHRMRGVIERLIANRWDMSDAIFWGVTEVQMGEQTIRFAEAGPSSTEPSLSTGTRFRRVPEPPPSTDNALLSTPGGIDFNANKMDLQTQGSGMKLNP